MTTLIKCMVVGALTFSATTDLKQSRSSLLGSWKVISVQADYPPAISEPDKMKAQMQFAKQEQAFKASPFVFHENGNLEVMKMNDQYKLSKDGRSFQIIIMKKDVLDAKIVSLSSGKLVFTVLDHEVNETFTLQKNL